MNEIIQNLEREFNVQILKSILPLKGENTYNTDESGRITSLYLRKIELSNIDRFLDTSSSLTELSLEFCEIRNIKSIKSFNQVKKLILSYNPLLSSEIEQIKYLKELNHLELNSVELKNTKFLQDLVNLELLSLCGSDHLYEIKELENLDKLRNLNLSFNRIDSFSKLSLNKNIESINLRSGKLTSLVGVEKYPNLIELNLSGNSISKIENLENLKNLKYLNLSSMRLSKIEGLDKLYELEVLDISDQLIKLIEGLGNLKKLKQLNLSENNISRVENLDNLQNFEYVLLEHNDIVEFDSKFLNYLNSSCFISLVGNPIKEIKGYVPDNVKIQFEEPNWVPKSL
ncbi:MAG: hypothetical protein A3D31_07810 [Candidatus Fluviicola riflensis]|nr:MAG: hypothetical protein CHH17_07200 [Candidatus Fluviicola riflensis]OGS79848.1 MAG: hypothetical protein A3D31_07810 [Candidatus Fluviicola riflensis]OGS82363.1 MAG: hypothetical protein A2724_16755 [Fluviicola sp. RIFCSPHIGHO2_01_FULL_43_53]OGS88027.1 MAG: hypothetical protein A3E30_14190 [Fluviicola sp. RIFCSPHIGHO2_12_FULL_43_24]